MPTPIAHGDDDRIVPIAAAARTAIDLVPTATPRVYPGAPHGLTGAYGAYGSYEREFDAALLAFLAGELPPDG